MRISDWSSDVCSSDLHLAAAFRMDFNVLHKHRSKRFGIAIARGNEKGLRDTASLGCLDAEARPGDLDMLARARGQLAHSRWLAAQSHGDVAQRDVEHVVKQEGCAFQWRQTLHREH